MLYVRDVICSQYKKSPGSSQNLKKSINLWGSPTRKPISIRRLVQLGYWAEGHPADKKQIAKMLLLLLMGVAFGKKKLIARLKINFFQQKNGGGALQPKNDLEKNGMTRLFRSTNSSQISKSHELNRISWCRGGTSPLLWARAELELQKVLPTQAQEALLIFLERVLCPNSVLITFLI